MPARIEETNGFRAMKTLERAAEHPGIAEIEGHGMDAGRVFLHAADGWCFDLPGYGPLASKSVGTAADVRDVMAALRRRDAEGR